MKAEVKFLKTDDKQVVVTEDQIMLEITPESPTEAVALKYWYMEFLNTFLVTQEPGNAMISCRYDVSLEEGGET